MNRLSSFFRKLLNKQEEKPGKERFSVKAPEPSKRVLARQTRPHTHKSYAFAQMGNGAFKPLPRFVDVGVNRLRSIEFTKRHNFRVTE